MKRALFGVLLLLFAVLAIGQVHTATQQLKNFFSQLQTFAGNIKVGTITIQAPSTTTAYVLTLPSNGGTVGNYLCVSVSSGALGYCTPPAGSFVPGGDLSGSSTSPKATGIYGIGIQNAPSVTGQVLVYNSTVGKWVPTIIAGNTGHSVTLVWSASVSSGVTGYNVYRSTVSGGPYTQIAPLVAGTTYNDTNVTTGNRYCYVVRSDAPGDTNQESGNSPETCAQIPGASVQHTVNLTWQASTSTGVSGYNVYRGTVNGGPYTKITTNLVSGLSYADGTVASGGFYCYVVTAFAPAASTPESVNSAQTCQNIPVP